MMVTFETMDIAPSWKGPSMQAGQFQLTGDNLWEKNQVVELTTKNHREQEAIRVGVRDMDRIINIKNLYSIQHGHWAQVPSDEEFLIVTILCSPQAYPNFDIHPCIVALFNTPTVIKTSVNPL